MSAIAAAVKHMLAAGMPHEAIVAAVEEMEASPTRSGDDAAERRRAWDRERKRKQRDKSTGSGGNPVETGGKSGIPVENADASRALVRVEENIKTSPKGESKVATAVVHPLPINQAFDAWDDMATKAGLPKIRDRSDKRVRQLRSRLSTHGMQGWLDAMGIIAGSKFLTGGNDRGWSASFDFVVKVENFTKILEGSYAKPGDRAAPKPAVVEDDAVWAKRLHTARIGKRWFVDEWGRAPGHPDCRVPQHLLERDDGDLWIERRKSA